MKRPSLSNALIRGINFYSRSISPYKGGPCCRFVPTCSAYARQAIERFGPVRGSRLAIYRLMRCNPCCKGGYDPVPEDPCTTFRKH